MDDDSAWWELAPVGGLLIALGVAATGLMTWWGDVAAVLGIGTGCGVLVILARRAWRGRDG